MSTVETRLHMSTKQQSDCVLKTFASLSPHKGAKITLNDREIEVIMNKCGFSSREEIIFFLKDHENNGYFEGRCDGEIIEGSITIEGYYYLEEFERKISGTVTRGG